MQRLMLGLGRAPSAPGALSCRTSGGGAAGSNPLASSSSSTAGSTDPSLVIRPGEVAVDWSMPADAGQPHYHKLTLERLAVASPGAGWQLVDEIDAEAHQGVVDQVGT
jgi:hypothetical protein